MFQTEILDKFAVVYIFLVSSFFFYFFVPYRKDQVAVLYFLQVN